MHGLHGHHAFMVARVHNPPPPGVTVFPQIKGRPRVTDLAESRKEDAAALSSKKDILISNIIIIIGW